MLDFIGASALVQWLLKFCGPWPSFKDSQTAVAQWSKYCLNDKKKEKKDHRFETVSDLSISSQKSKKDKKRHHFKIVPNLVNFVPKVNRSPK